ncbi:MAG: baseplate J/gp47 family protein [Chloroflexi bacterium]|nr:baseplate J/gp47 family protein [Chloroflexota bacterium]
MPTDDQLIEQVVFLDADDEVASIRTKLTTISGNRAAIVVPLENRSLRSVVAVRLVARMADDLALNLAVVSGDVTVRRLASEEGLLVFRTVKGYKDYVRRQSAALGKIGTALYDLRLRAGRTFGVVLFSIVLVLGGGMAYAVIPGATITLVPVSEKVSDVIVMKADPQVTKLDPNGRQIPARAIYVLLEASAQVPTTGRQQTPNAKSEGQVTFTNRSGEEINVPGGTIVRTADNIRFTTTGDVTVRSGQGSTAKIEIIATEPGTRGNVERGKISKIEGALDAKLVAFNEEPTTGGGAREVAVITAADKERAKAAAMEKLNKDATTKLEAERKRGERLPEKSVSFTVLEEVYDRKEGEQAKVLNLKVSARAGGILIGDKDVNDLVASVWQPRVRPGYYVPPGAYRVDPPQVTKIDGEVLSFVVTVEGSAVARINENVVRENVRWKTADEARAYLVQSLNLAKEPKIDIKPDWAKRALRVDVIIEGDWKNPPKNVPKTEPKTESKTQSKTQSKTDQGGR